MDFDPQRKGSFVSGSGRLCQISSKSVQNCDRESTDRHTDRDHTSDLIICPMLFYSNGTDNESSGWFMPKITNLCLHLLQLCRKNAGLFFPDTV